MRQRKNTEKKEEKARNKYKTFGRKNEVKKGNDNDTTFVDNSQFIMSREIVIEHPKDIHFKCKKEIEELGDKVYSED
jgi:hypothetical protein